MSPGVPETDGGGVCLVQHLFPQVWFMVVDICRLVGQRYGVRERKCLLQSFEDLEDPTSGIPLTQWVLKVPFSYWNFRKFTHSLGLQGFLSILNASIGPLTLWASGFPLSSVLQMMSSLAEVLEFPLRR